MFVLCRDVKIFPRKIDMLLLKLCVTCKQKKQALSF